MTRIITWRPRRRLWALLLLAPAIFAYAESGAPVTARGSADRDARPEQAPRSLPVTVAQAVRREIVQAVAVSGTLVPREEVLVGPQIEGVRVEILLADVGDRVAAGDVLARLDRRALDAQLAQNASEQMKARAEIAQARALLVQAEASEFEAAAALKRAQTLERTGAVTAELLQARDTAHRVAVARSGAQREAVAVAEAQGAVVAARGREIALKLEQTEVIAPDGGIVSSRAARVGQIVGMAGEPLFRIIRDGEVEFAAEIPENSLHLVSAGQDVAITVSGRGDAVTGRVRLVTPTVDAATRLGVAKVALPVGAGLEPGRFATATVESARRDGVVVPRGAVSFGPSGSRVHVVDAGLVTVRVVTVGLGDVDGLEILEGLSPGENVVARASSFLRDGDRVTAVRPDAGIAALASAAD